MTVPIWPTELPRPNRAGYGRTLPDGRSSTRPEAGPPRVRRRFSAAPSPMTLVFDMTLDQRARFHLFWSEDTAGGSLPFWMADWTLDGHVLSTDDGSVLTTDSGADITIDTAMLVMFATDQAPAETIVGLKYRFTVQLSIMP